MQFRFFLPASFFCLLRKVLLLLTLKPNKEKAHKMLHFFFLVFDVFAGPLCSFAHRLEGLPASWLACEAADNFEKCRKNIELKSGRKKRGFDRRLEDHKNWHQVSDGDLTKSSIKKENDLCLVQSCPPLQACFLNVQCFASRHASAPA